MFAAGLKNTGNAQSSRMKTKITEGIPAMSYKETLMDITSIQIKINKTAAQIDRLRSKLKRLEHKSSSSRMSIS